MAVSVDGMTRVWKGIIRGDTCESDDTVWSPCDGVPQVLLSTPVLGQPTMRVWECRTYRYICQSGSRMENMTKDDVQ